MLSGSAFQAIGPATEKARRPNCVRRWRGTSSWLLLAERRCCLLAISATGVLRSAKYGGALCCIQRWTVTQTRCGISNQCSSSCSNSDSPWSCFRVLLTTRDDDMMAKMSFQFQIHIFITSRRGRNYTILQLLSKWRKCMMLVIKQVFITLQ